MVKGWFIQSRVDTVELFPDDADEDSIGVVHFSFWFPDGSNTDHLGTFYKCTIYAVNCVKSAFLDTCLLDEDLSLFHPAAAPGLGIPLPEEDDELGHAEADVGEAAEADEDQVEALALEAVQRHCYPLHCSELCLVASPAQDDHPQAQGEPEHVQYQQDLVKVEKCWNITEDFQWKA